MRHKFLFITVKNRIGVYIYGSDRKIKTEVSFLDHSVDLSFTAFSLLSTDDVIGGVRRLPDKSSPADPTLTNVLKQVADLVAPFIVELLIAHLALVMFLKFSARRSSLQFSRSRVSTVLTSVPIVRFRTYRFYRSSWSFQLLNHLTTADLLPALQSVFERVIRPKPLCCACCQIFFMLSTMEMWLFWFFWTYQPLLIWSICSTMIC